MAWQFDFASSPSTPTRFLSVLCWKDLYYFIGQTIIPGLNLLTLEFTHFKAFENSLWIFSGLPVSENQRQISLPKRHRKESVEKIRLQDDFRVLYGIGFLSIKSLSLSKKFSKAFLPWLRTCNLIYSLHKLMDVLNDLVPLLHTVKACFGRAAWSRTLTYMYMYAIRM